MVQPCLTLIIYHFLYDNVGVSSDDRLEASRILKLEWNRFKKKIGKPFREYIEDELEFNEEAKKIKEILIASGGIEGFLDLAEKEINERKMLYEM